MKIKIKDNSMKLKNYFKNIGFRDFVKIKKKVKLKIK